MDPFHFSCPHCTAPLRSRDPLSVGREVHCPECGDALRIIKTRDGLRAVALTGQARATKGNSGRSLRGGQVPVPGASSAAEAGRTATSVPGDRAVPGKFPLPERAHWPHPGVVVTAALGAGLLAGLVWWSLHEAGSPDRPNAADSPARGVFAAPEEVEPSPAAGPTSDDERSPELTAEMTAGPAEEEVDPDEVPADGAQRTERGAATEIASSFDSPTAGNDDDPDDPPLHPEFAPEPAAKDIDLAAALRQPVLLFDQPQDRRLIELLPALSEMLGAPIEYDGAEDAVAEKLRNRVGLHLEKTTVGEILDGLLKPAGLAFRVERRRLWLIPRE